MSFASSTRVILNPAASGGRGATLRPRVEAALRQRDQAFSLVETESPGHAVSLARALAEEGVERILVVGGDGTIHEAVNGILEFDGPSPVLGVLPVGTGNDFYRMVASTKGLDAALDAVLSGEVRRFDVGRVHYGETSRYFVNLLGVGVDVAVLEKREGFRRLRGLPQYLAAFGSALWSFRPEPMRVSIRGPEEDGGGETIEDRTILAAVTVGPSVGGGFFLSPDASPYDGLLDLFFVEAVGIAKIARFLPRVIRGTHGGIREIRLRQFSRGTMSRPDGKDFHFELDGERMPDPVKRLEIEICPGVLPVVVAGAKA